MPSNILILHYEKRFLTFSNQLVSKFLGSKWIQEENCNGYVSSIVNLNWKTSFYWSKTDHLTWSLQLKVPKSQSAIIRHCVTQFASVQHRQQAVLSQIFGIWDSIEKTWSGWRSNSLASFRETSELVHKDCLWFSEEACVASESLTIRLQSPRFSKIR